ncbi:hypothetical protein HYS93_03795 [Candidatus Daviesbacteria bacterium]|nr:hypothetical protein [Candidatus Daviesbacteria bacterium]
MKYKLFILFLILLFPTSSVYAGGLSVPQNIKIDSIECGEEPKQYVSLSWDQVRSATSYRVYTRVEDGKYTSYDEVKENSYKLGFNPKFNFYLAVSAVNNFTGTPPQILESDLSPEYFISIPEDLFKMCPEKGKGAKLTPLEPVEVVISETPEATESIEQQTLVKKDQSQELEDAQKKVKQLEEKVNKLEDRLGQTEKKQSFLEKILNNILNFLKSFFKFEP